MPAANVLPKPSNLTLRGGGVDAARPRDGVADARDAGQDAGRRERPHLGRRRRPGRHGDPDLPPLRGQPDPGRRRRREGRQGARDRRDRRHRPQGRGRRRRGCARSPRRPASTSSSSTPGRTRGRRRSRALRWGGRLVVCGASTGFEAVTDLRFLWNKQQNLLGSHLSSKAELAAALRAVEAGHIKPVIDHVFPLAEVRQGPGAHGGPEGAGQARVRAFRSRLYGSPVQLVITPWTSSGSCRMQRGKNVEPAQPGAVRAGDVDAHRAVPGPQPGRVDEEHEPARTAGRRGLRAVLEADLHRADRRARRRPPGNRPHAGLDLGQRDHAVPASRGREVAPVGQRRSFAPRP